VSSSGDTLKLDGPKGGAHVSRSSSKES